MKYPLIFITGPTATGKSEVAFLLAKKIKAEIISSDAMLVYKEPKIITNRPPSSYLKEIKHNFIGVVSVKESYNVYKYFKEASSLIKNLIQIGKNIIVCGGSGLYIKTLLDGIFEAAGEDKNLREELRRRTEKEGLQGLYNNLQSCDPLSAQAISPRDLRRIIRALEVYHLTGKPLSFWKTKTEGLRGKYPIEIFGLTLRRKLLYERINKRVEEMFKRGAVEEVKKLIRLPLSLTAGKIIGLREIEGYLKGEYSLEEAKELMKLNSRHFAKRQITWFKKEKQINWIDVEGKDNNQLVRFIMEKINS